MRLPIEYLANIFTAGDTEPVKRSPTTYGNDEKLYEISSYSTAI